MASALGGRLTGSLQRFANFCDEILGCTWLVEERNPQTGIFLLGLIHPADNEHRHGWTELAQFADEDISAGAWQDMVGEDDPQPGTCLLVPE